MINYITKSLNLEGGFTTLVRVFFTGTVCGVKIGYITKSLNLEGGFTTLVRVFFTGTVCGVNIGFGS